MREEGFSEEVAFWSFLREIVTVWRCTLVKGKPRGGEKGSENRHYVKSRCVEFGHRL